MEFTKEHRENLSKALKGRKVTWADKIAESMKGNQNAKGQDFSEMSSGIYKGFEYHAKAERNSDRTWTLHITFYTPFTDQREVKISMDGARKVTASRLEAAYNRFKRAI